MIGKLYGIGVGPGDPDLLCVKATKILQTADCVFVPEVSTDNSTALKIANDYINVEAELIAVHFPMTKDDSIRQKMRKKNASVVENKLKEGKQCVFLTLGDPMLYSTFSYVLEYLPKNYTVESIPGIYSFSAISNCLNLPLVKGNDRLVVIGSFDQKDTELFEDFQTIVCMKVSAYHKLLYDAVKKLPVGSVSFSMVSEVGTANEMRYNDIEVLKDKPPYFSTAIITKSC